MILTITGKVSEFMKMDQKYARLVGPVGSEVKKRITITLEKDYPFTIVSAKARSGKDIAFDLQPFHEGDNDGYILTITNKKTETGRYADTILLTTDSKIKPTIRVPVYGQIVAKAASGDATKPKKNAGNG